MIMNDYWTYPPFFLETYNQISQVVTSDRPFCKPMISWDVVHSTGAVTMCFSEILWLKGLSDKTTFSCLWMLNFNQKEQDIDCNSKSISVKQSVKTNQCKGFHVDKNTARNNLKY